jgi:hypothetical protein
MWRLQQDERRGDAETGLPGGQRSIADPGELPGLNEAAAAAAAATLRSGS